MPRAVHIVAPSRLHFGLWALAASSGRQFGGVGAMVKTPALEIAITEAEASETIGTNAERILLFARRWAKFHRRSVPPCRIDIQQTPPPHAGLGSGTQLALAVAAGLSALYDLPCQLPQELAVSVGRGLRSAVGTYGFVLGGLIVEQGKEMGEAIAPLDCRLDLPPDWRFVLVCPRGLRGLAGEDEESAIGTLPVVPREITEELIAETHERLLPAAATGDFEAFADSVYRYGRAAGQLFESRQGGPYNGPLLTALVKRIRALGYLGVGQSSWGPTIFAVTSSNEAANHLAATLATDSDLDITVSTPCNDGARVEVISIA